MSGELARAQDRGGTGGSPAPNGGEQKGGEQRMIVRKDMNLMASMTRSVAGRP